MKAHCENGATVAHFLKNIQKLIKSTGQDLKIILTTTLQKNKCVILEEWYPFTLKDADLAGNF